MPNRPPLQPYPPKRKKGKTSCRTWKPPRNMLLRSRVLLRPWLFTPIILQLQLIITSTTTITPTIPSPCTRRNRRLPTHHTPRVRSTTTPLPPHLTSTHPPLTTTLLLMLLIKPHPIRPGHTPKHHRQRQRPRHPHRARRHVEAQVVHCLFRVARLPRVRPGVDVAVGVGRRRRQKRRHQRGVGAVHKQRRDERHGADPPEQRQQPEQARPGVQDVDEGFELPVEGWGILVFDVVPGAVVKLGAADGGGDVGEEVERGEDALWGVLVEGFSMSRVGGTHGK